MRLFIFLFVLLMPMTVQADEVSETVFCKKLAAHKPADNVAYQPGVDVHGKDVAPADLNAAPFKVPDIIKIPLEAELAERLQSLQEINVLGDAPLGMVEIHKDGRVFYDGHDISTNSAIICGQSQRIVTEVKEIPLPEDDRQETAPRVESEPIAEDVPDNSDAMTSFAEEKGLLEQLKPQPRPQVSAEEIEVELKSIVNDMNDIDKSESDFIEGEDFRE